MNDINDIKTGLVQKSPEDANRLWSQIMNMHSAARSAWIQSCENNRSFYFGDQWTETDAKKLADRGQYKLTINKIRSSIRRIVGMLGASIPKYRIVSSVGSSPFDKYITTLSNRILEWAWQNSSGTYLLQKILKRALIDNIAYAHIYFSKEKKIKYMMLRFDEVLVHPGSKDPMFEDAEYIAIKRRMSVSQAKATYGISEPLMSQSMSHTEVPPTYYSLIRTYDDAFSNNINVYEVYRKVFILKEDGSYNIRIVKETLVGYYNAYVEVMPDGIRDYPIVPFYAEDTDNPYRLGEVEFIKDLQMFINKAFGVVLFNAQQMSNPKAFLKQTDIPTANLESFADNYAAPGSINILSPNAEMPLIVPGQPLNQSFFTMYQEASRIIDEQTISPMISEGVDSSKMQMSSELEEVRESVLDKFRDVISNLEQSCEKLGRITIDFAKAYLPGPTTIILFGNPGDKQRLLRLNQPMKLNPEDKQSIDEFTNYLRQQNQTEEQIEEALAEITKDNSIARAKEYYKNSTQNMMGFDMFVIPGSTTTNYKSRQLRLMLQLYQQQLVGGEEVLRHTGVEDPDDLIRKYGTMNRLKYENERLKSELEEMEVSVKKLTDGVTESEKAAILSKHEASLYKIEVDSRVKQFLQKKLGAMMGQAELQKMSRDISVEVTKQIFRAQKTIDKVVNDVKDGQRDPVEAKGLLEHLAN